MSTAWFCPACQKYHAPHVETCPGGTGGLPFIPWWTPVTPTLPDPPDWQKYMQGTDPCADCAGKVCMNAACPKLARITCTAAGDGGTVFQ